MAHCGGPVASSADLWTKHKYGRTLSLRLSPMVTTPINGAPSLYPLQKKFPIIP